MVSGVNFLTGLLIARFLGMQEFGVFTLLWMAVLFLNALQMAAISAPMMSIAPKLDSEQQASYLSVVTMHQVVSLVATALILYAAITTASELKPEWEIGQYALPLAIAGSLFQTQDFLRRFFFCRKEERHAFVSDSLSYVGQLCALVFLLVFFGGDITGVFRVIAVTSLAGIVYALCRISLTRPTLQVVKSFTWRNWQYACWSIPNVFVQWGAGQLVFIVTGAMLGAASVGILKACQNILAVSHVLFQAMENFVPAAASRVFAESGINGLKNYVTKVTIVGATVTVLAAAIIGYFSGDIMLLVYGQEFSGYQQILQVFSVVYIFMFFAFPLSSGIRAMENTKAIFSAQLSAALVVAGIVWPLISQFSIYGSVLALLSGYFISDAVMAYVFYSESKRRVSEFRISGALQIK